MIRLYGDVTHNSFYSKIQCVGTDAMVPQCNLRKRWTLNLSIGNERYLPLRENTFIKHLPKYRRISILLSSIYESKVQYIWTWTADLYSSFALHATALFDTFYGLHFFHPFQKMNTFHNINNVSIRFSSILENEKWLKKIIQACHVKVNFWNTVLPHSKAVDEIG